MKTSIYKENGITLIALVVTIIVLLILAGVTLSIALDNEGLIGRARSAKEIYKQGEQNDLAALEEIDNFAEESNKGPLLLETITSSDYGKPVNYSVTIDGDELTNWKVFLNNGNNVYLIYGDYLESKYIDSIYSRNNNIEITSVPERLYNIKSTSEYYFVEHLKQNFYWKELASGYEGATATGSPTLGQINQSLGRDYSSTDPISGELYLPHNGIVDSCEGYWLATVDNYHASWWVKFATYNGDISRGGDGDVDEKHALRPVICLPATATGTIGNSVILDK